MGAWEEQAKRTTRQRKLWLETQEFIFIDALQNATNEEEVKAAYVREFSLPVKIQERHDLLVDKILFEFKYSVKLHEIKVAAKVIAQTIYYVNRLFKKGRIDEVKYLVVADKDEARLFKVEDFQIFYKSNEYEWDNFRPSSPDPQLIKAIKNSKILESNRIYKLTCEDELYLFSSRLYQILSIKPLIKPKSNLHKIQNISLGKFWIIGFGLILILSASIGILSQQYLNNSNKSVPTQQE